MDNRFRRWIDDGMHREDEPSGRARHFLDGLVTDDRHLRL